MPVLGKIKAGSTTYPIAHTLFGKCDTAANTAAKVVTCTDFDSNALTAGLQINVRFANANIATSPTLNINGTGAKNIYRYGTTAPSTSVATSWSAGEVVTFTYYSGAWLMNDWNNTDTHYTTHLYAGTGTAANAETTNGNTKITITDNSTVRDSITIKGGSTGLEVKSDANGNIIINDYWVNNTTDGVTAETVEGELNVGSISIPIYEEVINRYCVCDTAADTAEKTASLTNGTFSLEDGVRVTVNFANKNTANNPKLNINSTGAKNIWHNGATITSGGNKGMLYGVCDFVYNTTNGWCFVGNYVDTNTTYTNASLGQGLGTCATAEATAAKEVVFSGYTLILGGIVTVRFTYAVPANATMNINTKGAKNIKFNNANIVADIIKAGDTATFIYDGSSYHLIAIDRWATDISNLQTVSYTREVIVKNTNISGAQITWYCKKYGDKTVDCYGVVRPTLSNYGTLSTFYAYYIEVDLPYTMDNTNYHADASWKIAGGLVMNGGDRISYSTTKMRTYAVSPLSGSQSCDISIHLTGEIA